MINRTIIRQKIVQLMYAYYMDNNKSIETAEEELVFSLSKAYDLYNYMLLLIPAVTLYAEKQVARAEEMNRTAHIDTPVSHKFINNLFASQLADNKQLNEYKDDHKKSWSNDIDYVKRIYDDIVASEIYANYMKSDERSYAEDRELWRSIYKHIIMKDNDIDELLEDQSLYWNDDRTVVDTFILKTIKRFEQENDADQPLLPEYSDDSDREFALRLFKRTITNADFYRSLISQNTRNWEFDRLAYMDIIIMQIAIAEILSFPQIPVSVSINEYVELSKYYSTPRSAGYINGILDTISNKLKAEGKIMK